MHIHETHSELAFETKALERIVHIMHTAITTHGQCIVGLSGGSTPGPMYRLLKEKDLDWSKVKIFLVDERYVPADHKDSNQRLVRDTLLSGNQLTEEQILFPDTSLPIEKCVSEYAKVLKDVKPHLVILGMGEDGHIASLFPPLTADALSAKVVIHTEANHFAVHDRISVTLPYLQSADKRLFLISGAAKHALFREMIGASRASDGGASKKRSQSKTIANASGSSTRGVSINIKKWPVQGLADDKTEWIVWND